MYGWDANRHFILAGITGFAEPLGAALGWAFFTLSCSDTESPSSLMWFGVMFGLTAGIMTEVAIKALMVEAVHYDPNDRISSTVSENEFSYELNGLLFTEI